MSGSVLIGKIVNVHGIHGELKVYPYTDDIYALAKQLKNVYLDEKLNKAYNVKCRVQKNMILAKIEGIDTVEDAEKLRDKNLYMSDDDLEELKDGSYYIKDLIGLDIVDKSKDEIIGTLEYIFNTGANDIYEIKKKDGSIVYLPAIKQVVKKIDIKNKKIYVEPMEGLM